MSASLEIVNDAWDAIMSFNLPWFYYYFVLLFGVFVMFLTPETIVLAIVFHACGALFVPTIPKSLVISIYLPVISIYYPKKLYDFNLLSINFPIMQCDFNLPWHCQPYNFNLPSDSFNLPGHSRVIQFTKTLHKLNSLPQPGDFNLPSDVYFRVFQFTVSEFQFTITKL